MPEPRTKNRSAQKIQPNKTEEAYDYDRPGWENRQPVLIIHRREQNAMRKLKEGSWVSLGDLLVSG